MLKNLILSVFTLFSYTVNCQTPEPVFIKEINISIKAGTTINVINKTLYENLNSNLTTEPYKPINTSYYINPYISIGGECHLKKHFGFQFNLGFYQTLQKYNSVFNFQQSGSITIASSNTSYNRETASQYLNNNVFLELLPAYIYKHTRVLAGFNVTRTSPTILTRITITDLKTGEKEFLTLKDRPEESYHVYSVLGIMQGFPIKSYELTLTATYFGLLQKYDSGINLTLGFMF